MGVTGLSAFSGMRAIFGGVSYVDEILALFNPIAWWRQAEGVGAISNDVIDSPNQDGAYTGISWRVPPDTTPNSGASPYFDGANDYDNVFTGTFQGNWNGAVGSVMVLARVEPGAWTDGANRYLLHVAVDANNEIRIWKTNANNTVRWIYRAGGSTDQLIQAGHADTDWFTVGMTWIRAAPNEIRFYFNGVLELGPQAIGVWVGNIVTAIIGASTLVPALVWHGNIADVLIFDTVLSGPQMATLSGILRGV